MPNEFIIEQTLKCDITFSNTPRGNLMEKRSNALRTTSILMLMGIPFLGVVGLLAADAPDRESQLLSLSVWVAFFSLLVAGILGLCSWKNPENAKRCFVAGIVTFVSLITFIIFVFVLQMGILSVFFSVFNIIFTLIYIGAARWLMTGDFEAQSEVLERFRKRKNVILIVAALLFLVLFIIQASGLIWVNRWNMGIADGRVIRNYLEAKYDKEFVVEARLTTSTFHFLTTPLGELPRRGVPIFAWPVSDPGYVIIVDVVRRNERSGQIAEIREQYYRRFLRPQLQEYAEAFFVDVFEEMKVDINLATRNRYPTELNHLSTLEDFFIVSSREEFAPSDAGRRFAFGFDVRIFLPSYDEALETEMRDAVRRFLLQTYENSPHVGVNVLVYYINEPGEFPLINTRIDDEIRLNWHRLHVRQGPRFEHVFWDHRFTHPNLINHGFDRKFTEVFRSSTGIALDSVNTQN
jgi:hypothetical protein